MPHLCALRSLYNIPVRDRSVYRLLYVLFALGTAHLLLLWGVEAQRSMALSRQVRLVAAQTADLESRVQSLREELKHADDPAYLEERARSLGYVYPNEVLHVAPR